MKTYFTPAFREVAERFFYNFRSIFSHVFSLRSLATSCASSLNSLCWVPSGFPLLPRVPNASASAVEALAFRCSIDACSWLSCQLDGFRLEPRVYFLRVCIVAIFHVPVQLTSLEKVSMKVGKPKQINQINLLGSQGRPLKRCR